MPPKLQEHAFSEHFFGFRWNSFHGIVSLIFDLVELTHAVDAGLLHARQSQPVDEERRPGEIKDQSPGFRNLLCID